MQLAVFPIGVVLDAMFEAAVVVISQRTTTRFVEILRQAAFHLLSPAPLTWPPGSPGLQTFLRHFIRIPFPIIVRESGSIDKETKTGYEDNESLDQSHCGIVGEKDVMENQKNGNKGRASQRYYWVCGNIITWSDRVRLTHKFGRSDYSVSCVAGLLAAPSWRIIG